MSVLIIIAINKFNEKVKESFVLFLQKNKQEEEEEEELNFI